VSSGVLKKKAIGKECDSAPVFMSTSTNNQRGSRHPPNHIFPYAHPQPEASVSPTFSQSPSTLPTPPLAFPSPFSTAQYDFPSRPTSTTHLPGLSPLNWERPRATSSYALESATLAFPEPQLHRGTSAQAISRPPPVPPRTPRQDVETAPRTSPAPSHRGSVPDPKLRDAKVSVAVYLERHD